MKCLDTYPLIEIATGNEKFASLLIDSIIIPDTTIAEFYYVLIQRYDIATAEFWYKKFAPYCAAVPKSIFIKAVQFRHENKKKNLSFFDCVGYVFSLENNYKFVTGDKEFEKLENVLFIK